MQIILDQATIETIVAYRDGQPLEQLADLDQVDGFNSNWLSAWQDAIVKGTLFRVNSEGQVNEGIRVAEAIVEKQANQVILLSIRVE